MSHRTQITLTDDQYTLLRRESMRTGVGLTELMRRSVDQTYGATAGEEGAAALEASFGAWRDRDVDGATYVERVRRGMGRRLAE